MNISIIIFAFLCFALTVCAVAAAFYLYGVNVVQRKMLVESKRANKRLTKEVELWQNTAIRISGKGDLRPNRDKRSETDSETKPMRTVAPSQVVAELQAQQPAQEPPKQPVIKSRPVPPRVAEEFLQQNK